MKIKTNTIQEAVAWLEKGDWPGNTLTDAWAACERGDFLLSVIAQIVQPDDGPAHKKLVLAAIECASPLKVVPEEIAPCLQAVRAWATDEGDLDPKAFQNSILDAARTATVKAAVEASIAGIRAREAVEKHQALHAAETAIVAALEGMAKADVAMVAIAPKWETGNAISMEMEAAAEAAAIACGKAKITANRMADCACEASARAYAAMSAQAAIQAAFGDLSSVDLAAVFAAEYYLILGGDSLTESRLAIASAVRQWFPQPPSGVEVSRAPKKQIAVEPEIDIMEFIHD